MPNRKHIKCAKIVGETMGNYHPHGDQAIYPTLVHMAQPWAMRERLVDGQGNFGSVEDDAPASMRYTEARLAPLGAVLMEDMDKDTVEFVPNYDETRTEPSVLPAAFPNLLVNGGTGIDQKIRKGGWKHRWFSPGFIIIGNKLDCVLVHVLHEDRAERCQAGL